MTQQAQVGQTREKATFAMQVSQQAWTFLGIETLLFLMLLYSLFRANRKLRPIMKSLSRSLRLSEDQFGDETNFVTSARTRYRRAAEQIEEVDAYSIASGELSGVELLHIGKWRVNIGGLSELMGSAPGVFITVGLLGTFVGLAANLQVLSELLNTEGGAPGEIVGKLGNVLGPMSTAFLSSLGGVFYSLLFWLIGLVVGCNRLLDETESLLTAYLEQVVQADCNRFSLMRASVERMELILSKFMSRFSEDVGKAIDKAMSKKIQEVFNSIERGSKAMELYAKTFDSGVKDLNTSGSRFLNASEVFAGSDFAEKFGQSTTKFDESIGSATTQFRYLSDNLASAKSSLSNSANHFKDTYTLLEGTKDQIHNLAQSVSAEIKIQEESNKGITEATKQLREARLAVGRENRTYNELASALTQKLETETPQRKKLEETIVKLIDVMDEIKNESKTTRELVKNELRSSRLSRDERNRLNSLATALLNQSNSESNS